MTKKPLIAFALALCSTYSWAEITLELTTSPQGAHIIAHNSGAGFARVQLEPVTGGPAQPIVEVVPPQGKTELVLIKNAALSASMLKWHEAIGDFTAQHHPEARYLRPLDRDPVWNSAAGYEFATLKDIPARIARDGRVVEVKATPFGEWIITLEHDDRTLSRYQPLNMDEPPEAGHAFKAGTVLGRTARTQFTFAALQATRDLSSENSAFKALQVQWRAPLAAEGGPASQEAATELAEKAAVATGEVSTVGNQATTPPPPADAVASSNSSSRPEVRSNASASRWKELLALVGGLVFIIGLLGGWTWWSGRKNARAPIAGGHFEPGELGRRPPPTPPHGHGNNAGGDPYKQIVRHFKGDEAKVESLIEKEMQHGLSRPQAVQKVFERIKH